MDTKTLLDFVEEYERARGFRPRRVYLTPNEWTQVATSVLFPKEAVIGKSRYGEFGSAWFYYGAAITYARSAPQIRAWDLQR